MRCSSYEVGNDKNSRQHQDDTGTTRRETATDERCNETTVCDESEPKSDEEDSAIIPTRQCDGLKDECQSH